MNKKIEKKHTDKFRHIFLNMLHLMQSKDQQQLRCCDNMPLPLVETVKAFGTDYSVTGSRQTNNATKCLTYS